jgi:hypothetical protein
VSVHKSVLIKWNTCKYEAPLLNSQTITRSTIIVHSFFNEILRFRFREFHVFEYSHYKSFCSAGYTLANNLNFTCLVFVTGNTLPNSCSK